MKKFMIALVVTLTALFVCVQAHGKTNYSAIWNNMSKGEKAARVVGILEGACYGGEELTKALLDSPQLTNFKGGKHPDLPLGYFLSYLNLNLRCC